MSSITIGSAAAASLLNHYQQTNNNNNNNSNNQSHILPPPLTGAAQQQQTQTKKEYQSSIEPRLQSQTALPSASYSSNSSSSASLAGRCAASSKTSRSPSAAGPSVILPPLGASQVGADPAQPGSTAAGSCATAPQSTGAGAQYGIPAKPSYPSSGASSSTLPPLFKLVMDSTLPMMSYPTPGQPQVQQTQQHGQQQAQQQVQAQAQQLAQQAGDTLRASTPSPQYRYPMAMPQSAMYFAPMQQLPTPPQQQQQQQQAQRSQSAQPTQQAQPGQSYQPFQLMNSGIRGLGQRPLFSPGSSQFSLSRLTSPTHGNAMARFSYPAATLGQSGGILGAGLPSAGTMALDGAGPADSGRKRKRVGASAASGARKKRECPICHNFYSNLTTHKSIHNKGSKPYSCPTCMRAFKRLNDLIRHEKCHRSKEGFWEYQCPFHPGPNSKAVRGELCHQTGCFTRCDTYKNHLKAIHFQYPPNTMKSERSKVSGHCKECGMYFKSVQDWLKLHIATGACPRIIDRGSLAHK